MSLTFFSEWCEDRDACINCRAYTRPCLRDTPEAQAKIALREERSRPARPKGILDRIYEARTATISGSLCESFTDILKWHYSQVQYRGTYRDELLLNEMRHYEERAQMLRGTKPRSKSEVAADIPGLKPHSIYDILYENMPMYALIRKDFND